MVIIRVGHFIAQYIFLVQLYPRAKNFYDRMKKAIRCEITKKNMKTFRKCIFHLQNIRKTIKVTPYSPKMTIGYCEKKAQQDEKPEKKM